MARYKMKLLRVITLALAFGFGAFAQLPDQPATNLTSLKGQPPAPPIIPAPQPVPRPRPPVHMPPYKLPW